MKDYDSLAKMNGGQSDDYDKLAQQFGAQVIEAERRADQAMMTHQAAPKDSFGTAKDIPLGMLKGASDIGRTALYPIDATSRFTGVGMPPEQRKQALSQFFSENANPDSLLFKTGEIGTQVAGTAGVGGVLAKTPILAANAPRLAQSVRTGGFNIGQPSPGKLGVVKDVATRMAGGGITGGAMTGMVNPEDYQTGVLLGSILPGAGSAGKFVKDGMKSGAKKLMQSAVKPTIEQLRTGKAKTAIDTMLKYGISPNTKGVEKMRGMTEQINEEIADRIANSSALINKNSVIPYLDETRQTFGTQVSPTSDLAAIQGVADDFLAHPLYPGIDIPVSAAQEMKQGTYRALKKKYGQQAGASEEAQKALARGLKDEIAKAIPEVQALNKAESELIDTITVAERRALMELNKNPAGLSLLAGNKAAFLAFMADRSAGFKALAARMLNRVSNTSPVLPSPVVRSGLLNVATD